MKVVRCQKAFILIDHGLWLITKINDGLAFEIFHCVIKEKSEKITDVALLLRGALIKDVKK